MNILVDVFELADDEFLKKFMNALPSDLYDGFAIDTPRLYADWGETTVQLVDKCAYYKKEQWFGVVYWATLQLPRAEFVRFIDDHSDTDWSLMIHKKSRTFKEFESYGNMRLL